MMVSLCIRRMIELSQGSVHDIDHFMKVYAFVKTIGELEKLDAKTQFVLELAAVVHDIACPGLREKYGKCDAKLQETIGEVMARELLSELDSDEYTVERVCWLVGHHHTYNDVHDIDHRILLEADFIVNAGENSFDAETVIDGCERIFATNSGKKIIRDIYRI